LSAERIRHAPLVGVAALVLAGLVAQVAVAGGSDGGPGATASVVSSSKFKKLKQQVAALQQQVNALSRQPGPQGPAGAAPACAGNGSGDTMVPAGAVCIDKYEASVWSSPTGGTQYGVGSDNYPCDDEGQDCKAGTAGAIYARSVPGVKPSGFITYFQAQQALANVGKRLPTNGEWQQAVAGTPDPGPDNDTTDCNTTVDVGDPVDTGSRSSCVSNWGADDMVGNMNEWVADWVPQSMANLSWDSVGTFSTGDNMSLAGALSAPGSHDGPGALVRGGNWFIGNFPGPFSVRGETSPSQSDLGIGFRGAR
jgi:hypothetical protein